MSDDLRTMIRNALATLRRRATVAAAALRSVAARTASLISSTFDLRDLHAYGGLTMIWVGVGMVSPAAAWALTGLLLFWLGVRS